MSAADSLTDALREVDAARAALDRDEFGVALVYFTFANRHHALAAATHAILGGPAAGPLPNADAVDRAIAAIRDALHDAARPARASTGAVLEAVAEGLRPILRELATPGADPVAVVAARTRNLTAAIVGTFDIRTVAERLPL